MDAKLSKRRTARAGFTLVELLVVIAIIGLLAGLVIVGGAAAMRAARRAAIIQEIAQMKMALGKYKSECGGDYPPDCYNLVSDAAAQRAFVRHLRKRFSRYQPPAVWDNLRLDVYNASSGLSETAPGNIDSTQGLDINNLDPTSALFFFLGGPPDYTNEGEPLGFSANPTNPFAGGGSRLPVEFEFDPTRIVPLPVSSTNTTEVYKYIPKYVENPDGAYTSKDLDAGTNSDGVPYVYFRARSGGYTGFANISGAGTCQPYARTSGGDWYKPKEFQIITAGLDGEFGDSSAVDSLNPPDDDNLTSFATGQLKDAAE